VSETKRSDLGTDISLIGPEHVRRYRETNGEVGYIWNGVPILILTTKGRKSGESRDIPIIFAQSGETYAIVASNGGSPKHTAWYLNILEEPHVKVQIKDEVFDGIARVTEGAERQKLWAEAMKVWPNYDVYQSRTTRQIPVVAIERARR
jgi:deazaflavin-dependent oxidoreductase (nitroreductase family)